MPAIRKIAIDVGQSAIGMVRVYGKAAEAEALARAEKFERSKDPLGFDTWTAIARTIRQRAQAPNIKEACAPRLPAQAAMPAHQPDAQAHWKL